MPIPITILLFKRSIAIASMAFTFAASANDIQVSNVSLTGNTGTQTFIQFDLSWENGWRDVPAGNLDLAWVFIKYRSPLGAWQHVWPSVAGHVMPAGCWYSPGHLTPGEPYHPTTNPVIGAMFGRDFNGSGTFSASGIQLNWDYSAQGLVFDDIGELQVFAIEMVVVPQGAFHLGSGGTEYASFTDGAWTSGNTIPYPIGSENAVPIAQTAGSLWAEVSINTSGTLPATYPKGFRGFLCMKYELSQQQYVDFLNTLTRAQQDARTGTDLAAGVTNVTNRYVMSNSSVPIMRSFIRCDGTIDANAPLTFYCDANGNGIGGEDDDGQWIACTWVNWADHLAFLDWCGLRPMSEFEFEKACRGPLPPVANEFPWGVELIGSTVLSYEQENTTNEGVASGYQTTAGNAVFGTTNGTPSGPKRSGLMAAHAGNNGRVTSGAGYYGIMDLAGNLNEFVISLSYPAGWAYTGLQGDGVLDGVGEADTPAWPTPAGGPATRGGSWNSAGPNALRTSDRGSANGINSARTPAYGIRGVRTLQ